VRWIKREISSNAAVIKTSGLEPNRAIISESLMRVVIVGHGAAGLTAALAAAERALEIGIVTNITVIERCAYGEHGGNTRYTPCYMRLEAPDRLSPDFVEDMIAVSGGANDRGYFETLAAKAPGTMGWLQRHGVKFHTPVYYLSVGPPRIQPVGGGEAIVLALTQAASAAGVAFIYDCRAEKIETDSSGAVTGLGVKEGGVRRTLAADAVVLACGGFQGAPAMLRQHFGPGGDSMRLISPGTGLNAGDGIRMGIEVGARTAGDWSGMHAEPIDPRARTPAAVVLVYPYGIVVDRTGQRFCDEGAGLVHETWEHFARHIHFNAPGSEVYTILDRRLYEIANWQRATRSEQPPIEAPTIESLAQKINVPADTLVRTVSAYNAACSGDPTRFNATIADGLAADPSLEPPKSNWARAIEEPPFLAWPLIGAIAYTFGGLATDTDARVLGAGGPIPGLYAAGEITGHFHGTAPNAVAVLRAAVYGRIAGRSAATRGRPS
jgi:tricarballylate dehydrogenase